MAPASSPERLRPDRGRLSAVVLVVAPLMLLLGMTRVVEPVRVSSASMAPTYGAGDELLVLRGPLASEPPRRGDVVVLRLPGAGDLAVKRVAATGGDRLAVHDGSLVVNGQPVVEPYVDPARVDGTYYGPVVVPEGTVFVLGDNRSDSVDSRTFGPVALNRVQGRVRLRLWAGP